jgi:hypothetical protein
MLFGSQQLQTWWPRGTLRLHPTNLTYNFNLYLHNVLIHCINFLWYLQESARIFWMVTLSKPWMLEPAFMLVLWHRVVLYMVEPWRQMQYIYLSNAATHYTVSEPCSSQSESSMSRNLRNLHKTITQVISSAIAVVKLPVVSKFVKTSRDCAVSILRHTRLHDQWHRSTPP